MSPDKLILKILSQIDPRLLGLLLLVMIAGVIVMILKNLVMNTAAYLQFRFNLRVGLKSWIEFKGKRGEIIAVSISTVMIQIEDGLMLIRMMDFRKSGYIILDKCQMCKQKKKGK